MNRRLFLRASGMTALCSMTPVLQAKSSSTKEFLLRARQGEVHLVGPDFPATKVWGFDGNVPGPPVRVTLGETIDVTVYNDLEVPTAVHWHGIRLPNAMDGVAGLTQPAILPGESFRYRFTPPDSGTYWYHSHVNAYEQVGRGLYGPLIVDEVDRPVVDRDLTWMLDDWRLLDDASIRNDFGAGHDRSHAGRIGNVPTVNGRFRDVFKAQSGERIRLRLINASNARNFALKFGGLSPHVIAIDGQPVKPFVTSEPVVVAVAGRVDLILDMTGQPGSQQVVTDHFYRDAFDLTQIFYADKPLRDSVPQDDIVLVPSAIPEPDLAAARHHKVVIAGGAMGGLGQAKLDGEWIGLRELAQGGFVWAMNNVVGNRMNLAPLIEAKAGESIRLTLQNDTAFPHPMHLHGHHMKLLLIDGEPLADPYWVDSPLLMPRQRMELAFVADNPGQWLFHCHVLEHHAAGLGALVQID